MGQEAAALQCCRLLIVLAGQATTWCNPLQTPPPSERATENTGWYRGGTILVCPCDPAAHRNNCGLPALQTWQLHQGHKQHTPKAGACQSCRSILVRLQSWRSNQGIPMHMHDRAICRKSVVLCLAFPVLNLMHRKKAVSVHKMKMPGRPMHHSRQRHLISLYVWQWCGNTRNWVVRPKSLGQNSRCGLASKQPQKHAASQRSSNKHNPKCSRSLLVSDVKCKTAANSTPVI